MMTLDELRAQKRELEQRIEKLERAETDREQRCDEIEQDLMEYRMRWMREKHFHQLVVRGFSVLISGTFPQYDYQVGARGGGSKRTFLDAVRACAEIIERETRG